MRSQESVMEDIVLRMFCLENFKNKKPEELEPNEVSRRWNAFVQKINEHVAHIPLFQKERDLVSTVKQKVMTMQFACPTCGTNNTPTLLSIGAPLR